MRGTRAVAVLALVAALVAAGCGSSGGGPARPGLTDGQRQALVAQLEAVRSAAAGGELAATQTAVRKFRSSVARLRRDGALSGSSARELRVGAARILARATSDSAPPAPQPGPAPTTAAPAPPVGHPRKAKGHGKKGNGHGHGHGHGKKGND